MTESKDALRQRLRAHPPKGDSGALCRAILRHPWFQAADTVMAYMAMPSEPDLSELLKETLRLGKRLALPRCEPGCRLTARQVSGLDGLIPGVFGIPEPGPALPVLDPSEIDLILVPGMAFDLRGRRLGRGKGYYDRYLAGYLGKTMGVSFGGGLLERVPTEIHDRAVDAVATEDAVIEVRNGR